MKNMKLNKLGLVILTLLSLCAFSLNIGGDGTSENKKMLYYLIGDEETYPNLRLSLWSEIE